MSKIAASCENCIWGKRFAEVEKPKSAKEVWEKKTFWQKFFGDYTMLRFEVACRNDHYDRYLNYRACTRFPKVVTKHKNDVCGEHKTD